MYNLALTPKTMHCDEGWVYDCNACHSDPESTVTLIPSYPYAANTYAIKIDGFCLEYEGSNQKVNLHQCDYSNFNFLWTFKLDTSQSSPGYFITSYAVSSPVYLYSEGDDNCWLYGKSSYSNIKNVLWNDASFASIFTMQPSIMPSPTPTFKPSVKPTKLPTLTPSTTPTASPTKIPTYIPSKIPTTSPTKTPTYTPSSSPTNNPTKIPTYLPSQSPTLDTTKVSTTHPSNIPTTVAKDDPTVPPYKSPTHIPTVINDLTSPPTLIRLTKPPVTFSPTEAPTDKLEVSGSSEDKPLHDRLTFKWASSTASAGVSLLAAWFFREKIAFHIIENWGYDYKLLYYDSKEGTMPIGEVGIRLAKSKDGSSEVLVCKIKDQYTLIEIDNGNNNGISEGLYNTLFNKLKSPQSDDFSLLESEKNQIRDFLLSHNSINFEDLGYIRGNIYKLFLDHYKYVHKEKHLEITRKAADDFRLSDVNPLHDSETSGKGVEMRPSASDTLFLMNDPANQSPTDQVALTPVTDTTVTVLSLSNLNYNNNLLNHPEAFEILKIAVEVAGKDASRLLIETSKDTRFFKMFGDSIKDNGIEHTIIYLFKSSNNEQTPDVEKTILQHTVTQNYITDTAIGILSTKQMLHNLPLLHYITQNAIESLGYNISLPDPSDNKALLVSLDLVLGNMAAQYLPEESIMNAMFVSTASSISFAARLIASDYLKNQETSDEPIEFAQECGLTIAANSLPAVVNYVFAKAFLPNVEISTLDMLGSTSFGVVQCYNNYKSAYKAESYALNTIAPYIADALTLWTLKDYMTLDTSSVGSLTASIKNAISVAASTYASHCVSDVMTDFIPQKVHEYIDTAFSYVTETATDVIDNLYDNFVDGSMV